MTLTEQHDVAGPVVYGYFRLPRYAPDRQAALTVTIADYCHRHELDLCGIFMGREDAANDDLSFTGLLDVVTLSGAYGVVLPTIQHLGSRQVAARRRRQVRDAGARLLVVRASRARRDVASALRRFPPALPQGRPSQYLR
ncbi:hypothetical protein ACGF0J_22385 [Nonomuraea sp. NPDC047897]|uniref:hypothetical protein n=1 Tax=Nonomuraea sp. NPDC047897 TaxID=3364346 RepID=UPI0037245B51